MLKLSLIEKDHYIWSRPWTGVDTPFNDQIIATPMVHQYSTNGLINKKMSAMGGFYNIL